MADSSIPGLRLLVALLALSPAAGAAAELPRAAIAPINSAAPFELAVQYELKVHLPEGRGLARSLLDVGVDSNDAALAARLAAGHMGAGSGGCEVKVSISRASQGSSFRVVRVLLLTAAGQTVIERRGGDLTIASEAAASLKNPRLV